MSFEFRIVISRRWIAKLWEYCKAKYIIIINIIIIIINISIIMIMIIIK